MGPVEEIHNDHINGKASSLIFPGHLQNLILGLVTQLTLPESHTVIRHHGNLSCGIRIGFLDLSRGITRCYPVIHLLCRLSDPLGNIFSKGHLADGRIVPENSVSSV